NIPINDASAQFTISPTATGSGQLQVNANGTRFGSTVSPVITVLPVATAPVKIDDNYSAADTATGVRRAHFVRLPSAAPTDGLDVQIQVQGGGALVSPCDPAVPTTATCVGAAAAASTTVHVPQNQNFAYFDLIGAAVAAADTRINNPADVAVAPNG